MIRPRRLRPRHILVAVTTSAFVVATPADAPPLDLRTQSARDGTTIEYDYGRLKVPENRSKADSREITLAFIRVRSPLPNPGPPVFMLAGGPGGSSIQMVLKLTQGGGRGFLTALGGDVVGIDQRGVGESDPNLDALVPFGFPIDQPGDPDEQLKRIRTRCRAEAQRWRERGVDLAGYTTVESADDIDAVRAALGYDQIVLWGESYGTHLAFATIRRHEPHIARAVLINPEGPDHTMKLPADSDAVLDKIHALVKADPALSAAIPDFRGSLRKVLDQLEREPVYIDVDGQRVGVSKFDVQQVVAYLLTSRRMLEQLPAVVQRLANGDFNEVARELARDRQNIGIESAMAMVMDSASGLSKARAALIDEQAKTSLVGHAVNFPYPHVAEAWGAPDLGDEFRSPLRTELPTLMITGDLDPRTPVSAAEELRQTMPNARLWIVENATHDVRWLAVHKTFAAFLAGEKIEGGRIAEPPPNFAYP